MSPPSSKRIVHVRFEKDDRDWLDRAARRRGVTPAETLRRLVKAQRAAEETRGEVSGR